MLKSFDLVAVSLYIFYIQSKQRLSITPKTGNWFISDSVRDLSLAYITLAIALFGLFVALNKHEMIKVKKYTYLAILLSWSSYLSLFSYKALLLGGSWLVVLLIVLIILSILIELLIGEWGDH